MEAGFKKSFNRHSEALLNTKNALEVEQLHQIYTKFIKNDEYPSGIYINRDEFINAYEKQLKIVGKCNYSSSPRNYNNTAKLYMDIGAGSRPKYLLSDGSCAGVTINSSTIGVTVDTNGPKKGPNMAGHDIFVFHVDNTKDALIPVKMKKLYTDDEINNIIYDNASLQDASRAQAGFPCSIKSKQQGNGIGCSWFALNDINPDTGESGYWKNLP